MTNSQDKAPLEKLDQHRLESYLEKLHAFDVDELYAAMDELRSLPKGQVIEGLTELLVDVDGNIRCDAAEALVRVDSLTGVDLIVPLLGDRSPGVRRHICGLLHDFGDQRAVEPLTKVLLNDEDSSVRFFAAYALEGVGDHRALDALHWVEQHDKGTNREGYPVSRMAAEAIESILARK